MRMRSESIARIALSLRAGFAVMTRALRHALCACALLASTTAQAVLDVAGIDAGADPCADFYAYANRRWLDSISIPDDRTRWGAFDEVDERNEKGLVAALDEARGRAGAGTPQ